MVVRRRLHLGGAVAEGGSGESPRKALSSALSLAISASAASSSFCSLVCLSASGAHVLGASAGASAAGASTAAGASAAGSAGFVAQALSKDFASSTPSKLNLASASPKPWLERSTTFFPSRSSERSWKDLTPSASLYCFRTVVRVSPFCVRDDEDHE